MASEWMWETEVSVLFALTWHSFYKSAPTVSVLTPYERMDLFLPKHVNLETDLSKVLLYGLFCKNVTL